MRTQFLWMLSFLLLAVTCRKPVTEPVYDSPYDETSETYIPTPGLNTAPVTAVTAISAQSGGVFENDYGKPAAAKGVCWSLVENPTHTSSCTNEGSGTTSFTSSLTNLLPDTLYYVRAYATNEAGTVYGGQRTFRTRDGKPVFMGLSFTDVTSSGVKVSATIDSDGGDVLTARGVCYSKEPDPTTEDTCIASGSGTGVYAVTLTGLDRATAYYVRPYAINSVMTGYGAQASFVTAAVLPSVETGIASLIGATSATVSGNVTSDGGSNQTSRGICYATTQNPTTANTCVPSGTGAGAFEAALTGLNMGTIYYARSYATNPIGTTYGSQISFTTLTGPTVTTGAISDLSSTGATIAGNVSTDGGSTVTARGVCYSTSQNPTLADTCVASGSGTGAFSATIAGLSRVTTYFARAYATNAVATSFGSQVSLTTHDVPTVTTGVISAITSSSATVAGNVTNAGGVAVTSRGICYSTTQNPTISGTCVASGTGEGAFTANLSALSSVTTYYVRAYATNSVGTTYGAQSSFITLGTAPVTDIDGNVYPTIQIGTQVWMAANLKTTRYRNGTSIPNVTNATTWSGLTTGAWSNYDNNAANDAPYGKLYNWYAVADSRNICPAGWHVPTDAEWTVLSDFLATDVGFKMKSTSGWDNNGNGSNASGFTGLPGGWRGTNGTFGGFGRNGTFWSSSDFYAGVAWTRYLYDSTRNLTSNGGDYRYGFSVRCLRD